MWNKYIMRLVRLVIGVFNPSWMPQAPKGETVRETLTLVYAAHVWNARWKICWGLVVVAVTLFGMWQAVVFFWPR